MCVTNDHNMWESGRKLRDLELMRTCVLPEAYPTHLQRAKGPLLVHAGPEVEVVLVWWYPLMPCHPTA
jgi:hypothetical protein